MGLDFDSAMIALVSITFLAATVNGAIGYGFSSLTVPVALIFYANRVLNPALVLVEVCINLYVLAINRQAIPAIWKRVIPILVGLAPGIMLGSYLLASLQPSWIKLGTYAIILPLILIQAAGWRRPIRREKIFGVPFGTGLGLLYSVTTISGPPLAVLFNNQGLVKTEFRAALALIRVVESSLTGLAYYNLGLFVSESHAITVLIIPSVLIGIPVGSYLIRRLNAETFRRICMSFDAWVVGFGASRVLMDLSLLPSPWAYCVLVAAIVADTYLLYGFFSVSKRIAQPPSSGPTVFEQRQNATRLRH
jgi:hypothetical protein